MNRRTSLAKDVSRKHVTTILVVTDDVGCAAHAVAGVAGKPPGG
jgi:dethiobiotin synthetase